VEYTSVVFMRRRLFPLQWYVTPPPRSIILGYKFNFEHRVNTRVLTSFVVSYSESCKKFGVSPAITLFRVSFKTFQDESEPELY